MGILNWVQNKISKGKEKNIIEADFKVANCTSNHETLREELVDWPQGLFAIGTFGNENPQRGSSPETSHSSRELPDLSVEEVIKLQKELKKLLTHKPKSISGAVEKGGDAAYLELNRLLNCPSSLDQVDQTSHLRISCDLDDENYGNLSPKSKIILKKARELLSDKRNAITWKSISFLLKKTFVCAGGFGPNRSLRDPIMESKMEKLLRTILHKKIYPQNSARASTVKYLEKNPVEETSNRDELQENEEKIYPQNSPPVSTGKYLEKNPVEETSNRDELQENEEKIYPQNSVLASTGKYLEKNPVEETSNPDELQENEEKIYPQNSARASTAKYLEKNPVEETSNRDELQENEEDRSKWVNTDSEFIVLEIETSHV